MELGGNPRGVTWKLKLVKWNDILEPDGILEPCMIPVKGIETITCLGWNNYLSQKGLTNFATDESYTLILRFIL